MSTLAVILTACAPESLEPTVSMTAHAAPALRAVYASDGVWVAEQSGDLAPVRMSLQSWGREGALERVDAVVPNRGDCLSRCERRTDYVRRGLVEWWEERSGDLEQGFTVASPPPGDGFLVFDIVVDGADVVMDAGRATTATFTRLGAQNLYYTGLAAWDEAGRTLPAWMEDTPDGLRLVLDDTDASGAVTVDPLLTLAWTAESDEDLSFFGESVSSAGDVNGDGYGDVVVGAYSYTNGSNDEGRAYLYLGSASGLETTEAWTAESDQTFGYFGVSLSSAGDVNGDGYGDVVVGADGYDNGSTDEGRAYLYLGSASGLETTEAWTAESDQAFAEFGRSVSSAGDVNGDGYWDVVVGAPDYDNGSGGEGKAYLHLGSASGLETTATWTAESNKLDGFFGTSVSSAGDVNADGYGDVVVSAGVFDNGSGNKGRAYLYLGSSAGLGTTAAWTAESNQPDDFFGSSVSSAGDVNADGYGDVVVGAEEYDNGSTDEGRAYLYLGSASGLETTEAWTAESDQAFAEFGSSVSSAGDVNADGYGDLVVGAFVYDNGSAGEGRAYVYLGSASGLEATAAWTAESDQREAYFGTSVSAAGDVNGDGYEDVIVGAPRFSNGSQVVGRAYMYLGGVHDPDLDGVPAGIDLCPYVADPGQEDADGDGIGDACVPLIVTVGEVSVSLGLSIEVDDALPGETVSVFLGRGPPEIAPCNPDRAGMCLDIGHRWQRWDVVADADGHASLVGGSLSASVVEGAIVTVQAAAGRDPGGVKSDPIETTVVP